MSDRISFGEYRTLVKKRQSEYAMASIAVDINGTDDHKNEQVARRLEHEASMLRSGLVTHHRYPREQSTDWFHFWPFRLFIDAVRLKKKS